MRGANGQRLTVMRDGRGRDLGQEAIKELNSWADCCLGGALRITSKKRLNP